MTLSGQTADRLFDHLVDKREQLGRRIPQTTMRFLKARFSTAPVPLCRRATLMQKYAQ
jgi:hypothetical protein